MSASTLAALPLIHLNPADNVAVARARVAAGEPLGRAGLRAET